MRKSLIVILLLSLLMIADAHAQCAPTDKIHIDPRLVPQQRHISREQMLGILMDRRFNSETRGELLQQYHQQGTQPIVIPYGTGKVLVSPANPCIQQYIP